MLLVNKLVEGLKKATYVAFFNQRLHQNRRSGKRTLQADVSNQPKLQESRN